RRKRAFAGRASRPVGHGEEAGLQLRELLSRRAQLLDALGSLGREELEAENALPLALWLHWLCPCSLALSGDLGRPLQRRSRCHFNTCSDLTCRGPRRPRRCTSPAPA